MLQKYAAPRRKTNSEIIMPIYHKGEKCPVGQFWDPADAGCTSECPNFTEAIKGQCVGFHEIKMYSQWSILRAVARQFNIPVVVYIGNNNKAHGVAGKFEQRVKYSLNNFALDYPSQALYATVVESKHDTGLSLEDKQMILESLNFYDTEDYDQDFYYVTFGEKDKPEDTMAIDLKCFRYENNIFDTYAQSTKCYDKILKLTLL